MSIRTYAVNCNDAWLNTEGDDISGSYVKYKDHQDVVAELKAKCAALAAELKQSQIDAGCYKHGMEASNERLAQVAAENAALKEWSPNPHSASMFEAIEKAEALMDDGMPELAMVEAFEILKMKRTPATDALLAEVRAQGAEECVRQLVISDDDDFSDAPNICAMVAHQFRQEAAQ